jgi:hypothetical protein
MKPTAERALKLFLPALILTEVFLVRSNVLSLRDALLVVVVVEVLLLAVGGRQVLLAARRYRRGRSAGLDGWAALEDGLAVLLPRQVARLVALEPRLMSCLFRWTVRRARPGEGEYTYHKRSAIGTFLPVVLLTAPVELALVHVLAHAFSPWAWLKWALLVLGVYAVFWVVAFYASLATLPHCLEREGLRLRYGLFAEAFVPYEAVEGEKMERLPSPGEGDGLQVSPEGDAAYLAIGGRTDLTLRLAEPVSVRGVFKEAGPFRILHLAADDPAGLSRALRERIPEAGGEARVLAGELDA